MKTNNEVSIKIELLTKKVKISDYFLENSIRN